MKRVKRAMTDLIVETIESYNDYLVKLPAGCILIAEKLRDGQVSVALTQIKNFSEGLVWLVDAGSLLKENDIDVVLSIEHVHEFLNEINGALEMQDYNLVADLFEYELVDFFKNSKWIIISQ